MKSILSIVLFLSTCVPASTSNNEIESQVFANSTNEVEVARRLLGGNYACDPYIYYTSVRYLCNNNGYTEVPNVVWMDTTTIISLFGNKISFILANAFNGLTLLTSLSLDNNAITSLPKGFVDTNIALKSLYLDRNPLVCPNFSPYACCGLTSLPWVFGTAISSICTSCTAGVPETITIGTVDFWQCPTCTVKNDAPSSTQVNDAMEVFCPDYATDVGVQGKPEYGGSAEMCRARDQRYTTRLHKAMFHGMFGGASSSGRDCGAWCLFDVEEQNRHFRWDNRNRCWKTKKNRPCTGSTNVERVFAADISDSFC